MEASHDGCYNCFIVQRVRVMSRFRGNPMKQCAFACVMAERRCRANAGADQNNGGTLNARKPCDPLSSYIILGVRSLTNASRARQFNPLNPPGVGWVNFLIYFLR